MYTYGDSILTKIFWEWLFVAQPPNLIPTNISSYTVFPPGVIIPTTVPPTI